MSGILPTLTTSGTVDDEKARLKAALSGTDQAVQACTALDTSTRASWGQFLVGAMSFVTEDTSFWASGAAMDRAQSYESELAAWQTRLKAAGCVLTTPAFDPNAQKPSQALEALKWVAVAAGVAAGAYAVGKVVEAAELFRPKAPAAAAEGRSTHRLTVWWRNPDHHGEWETWATGLTRAGADRTVSSIHRSAWSWFGRDVETTITTDGFEPASMGTRLAQSALRMMGGA